jgi:hypothetical protein
VRHDGISEPGDEHARLEQTLAHPDRRRGLAQDDGDDRRLARDGLETELGELSPEVDRVLPQPRDALGMGLEVFDRRMALEATVQGSALLKSCGRPRCVR